MESFERRDRVLAAIGEIPAPTRREHVRRQAWLVISGVLGALSLFWVEGGLRTTGRPPSLVAWTSLGTSCFVGAGMWFLFTRTRSGHRRGWSVLGLATIIPAGSPAAARARRRFFQKISMRAPIWKMLPALVTASSATRSTLA